MREVIRSLSLDIWYHLVTSLFIYDERNIQTPAFCIGTHWSVHISLKIKSGVFEQRFDCAAWLCTVEDECVLHFPNIYVTVSFHWVVVLDLHHSRALNTVRTKQSVGLTCVLGTLSENIHNPLYHIFQSTFSLKSCHIMCFSKWIHNKESQSSQRSVRWWNCFWYCYQHL